MTVRLLIHDTAATLPWTAAIAAGWAAPPEGLAVETRESLAYGDVGPEDLALLPTPDAALLMGTHVVIPTVAAVFETAGPVAMRTPVRPDEIARTPVRLLDCSSSGELLARGILKPFYGIDPAGFTREETADAQAVVVEGAEALRPVEAGFSEDLCRAFRIFTDLPAVTHVLVAPQGMGAAALAPALGFLDAAASSSEERRREWRQPWCDREGVPRDRLDAVLNGMRRALAPGDERALMALLSHGGRGTPYPTSPGWRYFGA